jgi:integrase
MTFALALTPLALVRLSPAPERPRLYLAAANDHGVLTTHGIVRLYMTHCRTLGLDGSERPLAPSTLVGYSSHEKNLLAHIPDVEPEALDPEEVKAAYKRMCVKDGQRGGKQAARSAILMFGRAWEHAVAARRIPNIASPTRGLKTEKPKRRRDNWVEPETIQAIIDEAQTLADAGRISHVARRAIQLAARLGQRCRSDLLPLRVGCVVQGSRGPVLRLRSRKPGGKMFRLALDAECLAILEECEREQSNGWLFPGDRDHRGRRGHLSNVYEPWDRVLEAVAAKGHDVTDVDGELIVPHQLRHAFTSLNLQAGVPPAEIGPALCHTNAGSWVAYAGQAPVAPSAPVTTYARILRGDQNDMGSRQQNACADLVREAKKRNLNEVAEALEAATTFHGRLCAVLDLRGHNATTLTDSLRDAGYVTSRGEPLRVRAVQYWCDGTSKPEADAIVAACRILRCSADYLLGVAHG